MALLTMEYQLADSVFVDVWAGAHGMPFVARAVVESFSVQPHYVSDDPWIGRSEEGTGTGWGRQFADRMRFLLSAADEETYAQVVTALAGCRDDVTRRIVVSYLLPGEQAWVDDCLPHVPHADTALRVLLLCSLGSPEQLGHFGDTRLRGWSGTTMALIATLAEGTGKAFAPLLDEALGTAYSSDRVKAFGNVLVKLPTDDAFRILLAHVEDKPVTPLLLEAARRYPVRALRLLSAAARGDATYASLAEQLLAGHVLSHPEVVRAALPDLPPEVAAHVGPLRGGGDRVAEAPVAALPPLLVAPPWTRKRTARRLRVAARTPAAPAAQAVWRDGEREAWAKAQTWYDRWRGSHSWTREIETLRAGGQFTSVREVRLFVDGPEDTVRPLLAGCEPEDHGEGEASLRPVAAKWGVEALPLLLRAATRHPSTLGGLLLPYLDVKVAGLVCDWLARLKSGDATARSWLTRHGLAAVPVLVPHAVGPAGGVRGGAEKALRLLAAAHGGGAVVSAAAASGSEAADIVAELLAADPLESALPAHMPALGAWSDPAVLPQILLTEGGAPPADAVRHVLTVLALCKPGEPYPGVTVLLTHCTADSLAGFAWGLFEQWRLAGMSARDSWALHALGVLGNDETVRRLTPVIRAWPGENAHHRAVEGLNVLAEIGTDAALTHLHGIAQRVPFKALRARAQEKIAEGAEGLGLTGEQLGDRLVPDFGLDAHGSTVVDYGPRRFTVGFDEQLRPYVRDADGTRRKDLPAPGAKDDPELAPAERKRFAALKKDVRAVASDQVRRLEAAMVSGRSWTAAEFQELFVSHPLLWHLVRRLVWLGGSGSGLRAFRVAEDRTFADVNDDGLTLPEDATVRLAHPLHLADDLTAWSELFADYETVQPFPQLGRPVHAFTEEEAAGHRLPRFEGATVPVGKLLGLTRRGWERGTPEDNGIERWFHRRIDDGHYLVIGLDEGIAVGMVDAFPDQTFEYVWLDSSPGDYWSSRGYPLRFGDLDPVIASEILADLTEVTAD